MWWVKGSTSPGNMVISPPGTNPWHLYSKWLETVAAFKPVTRCTAHANTLPKSRLEICDGVLIHSLLGALKPGIFLQTYAKAIGTLIDHYFVKTPSSKRATHGYALRRSAWALLMPYSVKTTAVCGPIVGRDQCRRGWLLWRVWCAAYFDTLNQV